MADLKISQLTSATLPLAGTEVLPIVQSSSTKKVATDDLTVKNVRSNATTGILQIAGPAAAATRTMTVPDANFTAARTDAAQSFTGNQTLSTGNLVIGTAGKGIDFSADPSAPGMTSELFNDYEEGTFTPTLTGATTAGTTTYTSQSGYYTKIGNTVVAHISMGISATTGSGAIRIGGLPFTLNANVSGSCSVAVSEYNWSAGTYLQGIFLSGTTSLRIFGIADDAAWAEQSITNESQSWRFTVTYQV